MFLWVVEGIGVVFGFGFLGRVGRGRGGFGGGDGLEFILVFI